MLNGCVTTSTYGATFQPTSQDSDTHFLKIYFGGLPKPYMLDKDFQEGTSSDLYKYASQFMIDNPHYKSYEIQDIEHSRIPSYFKYEVLFKR